MRKLNRPYNHNVWDYEKYLWLMEYFQMWPQTCTQFALYPKGYWSPGKKRIMFRRKLALHLLTEWHLDHQNQSINVGANFRQKFNFFLPCPRTLQGIGSTDVCLGHTWKYYMWLMWHKNIFRISKVVCRLNFQIQHLIYIVSIVEFDLECYLWTKSVQLFTNPLVL